MVWVRNLRCCELRDAEEDGGSEDAPEAGHAEIFDEEVGADSWIPRLGVKASTEK